MCSDEDDCYRRDERDDHSDAGPAIERCQWTSRSETKCDLSRAASNAMIANYYGSAGSTSKATPRSDSLVTVCTGVGRVEPKGWKNGSG